MYVVPVRNDNKWKEGIGSVISIVVGIVVGVPGITVRTVVIGPIAVRIGPVKRPDQPDLQIVALNHRIGILRLIHSLSDGGLAVSNDRNARPRRQDGGIKKVLRVVRKKSSLRRSAVPGRLIG